MNLRRFLPIVDLRPSAGTLRLCGTLLGGQVVLAAGAVLFGLAAIHADALALRVAGWVGLAALPIGMTAAAAVVLQRRVLRPVHQMTRLAGLAARGRPSGLRAEQACADAVGGLVHAFNDLLDRIGAAEVELRQELDEADLCSRSLREEIGRMRERIDAAAAEASALERADRGKTQLLSSLSHRIRTSLSGVIGMAELLLESSARMTSEQSEGLRIVRASAESLLDLVGDLEEFCRLEADTVVLVEDRFELREVLEGCVERASAAADDRCLRVAADVSQGVPEQWLGDARRLARVIDHLLEHAVKFSSSGEVVLRVDLDTPGETSHQSRFPWLRFRVMGSGSGYAVRRLERMITGPEAGTLDFGGAGLGLAIAARNVRRMGGGLGVSVDPRSGPYIRFALPLRPVPSAPRSSRGTTRWPVILLHGSEPVEPLTRTLEQHGVTPVTCAEVDEASAAIDRARATGRRFDAVVFAPAGASDERAASAGRLVEAGIPEDAFYVLDPARVEAAESMPSAASTPSGESDSLESVLGRLGTRCTPMMNCSPGNPTRERSRVLSILLAEDNPVNQKLTIRMLEKRGHDVDLAENGRVALEMLERRRYDVVLMDVMMPEMDGLEATAAIREREEATGERIPIIALTANAMKGDRERCLEAGMDRYLPKPIRPSDLYEAVESLLSREEVDEGDAEPVSAAPTVDVEIFDREQMLKRLGADEELLREILELFVGDAPRQLRDLEKAVEEGRSECVVRHAHTLKGQAANIAASRLQEVAYEMEKVGRSEAESASELLPKVRETFDELMQVLRD